MSHEIKRFHETTRGGFSPARGVLQLNERSVRVINPELIQRDNCETFLFDQSDLRRQQINRPSWQSIPYGSLIRR